MASTFAVALLVGLQCVLGEAQDPFEKDLVELATNEQVLAGVRDKWENPHSLRKAVFSQTVEVLSTTDRPPRVVTHTSWIQRLYNSLFVPVLGIALICIAFPFMWLNEKRNARLDTLMRLGEEECSTESADTPSEDKIGTLVHVSGMVRGKVPVCDNRFKQFKAENCIRTRSVVECYQWVERRNAERTRDTGGGETTETVFWYEMEWATCEIESRFFHDKSKRNECSRDDIPLGTQMSTCEVVRLGDSFLLPSSLVDQLSSFQNAEDIAGECVDGFVLNNSRYYYPAVRTQPQIGDLRVTFEYIPNCLATVVALQAQNVGGLYTFLPYRPITRGSETDVEALRRLRLVEARKTQNQLREANRCTLRFLDGACCCCIKIYNYAASNFFSAMLPELYSISEGDVALFDCWQQFKNDSKGIKWFLRGLGWLLLFSGNVFLFHPLFVAFDVVPVVGTVIGDGMWWGIGLASLVVTVTISTIVMSLAYHVYHPTLAKTVLAAMVAGLIVCVGVALFAGTL